MNDNHPGLPESRPSGSPDLQAFASVLAMSDRPRDLAAVCARVFVGPLACYADALAFEDDPVAVDAAKLADPQLFQHLLACFGERYRGGDARAIASFWSQHYFAGLAIPVVALCLAAEGPLPLDFGRLRVRFCPRRGVPLRFHLGCDGPARTGPALVKALYDEQIATTVATLKRHCGLSSRLSWENAGSYGTWILGEIRRTQPRLAAAATGLLGDELWPRAACSSWTHLKRATLEQRPCVRRLCCLRYRLPGVERCGNTCPLRDDDPG